MNLSLLIFFLLIARNLGLAGNQRYSAPANAENDQFEEDEEVRDSHQHSRAPLFLPNSGFPGLLGGGAFGAPARTIIVPTSAGFTQSCCPCNSGFSNQGFSNQGFSQQLPASSGPLIAAAGTNVNWPYLSQFGYGSSLGLGQQLIYSPLALSSSANERDGQSPDHGVTPSSLEGKRIRRRFRNRIRGT